MDNMFTDAGELGRRSGKGRIGQGAQSDYSKTANKKAVNKLQRYLVSKGEISKGSENLSKKLKYADQVKYMNVAVLGQALLYSQNLKALGKPLDTDNFNAETIEPYIKELIPSDTTDEEMVTMIPRLYFTFYRYVVYIDNMEETFLSNLRSENEEYQSD